MVTRLYIGKLGNISRSDLQKICSQYGQLKDFMMKDNYAFVEYNHESDARNAQMELDGRSINGQRILVEFAKPKPGDNHYFQAHPRLYIGRLNSQISKQELTNLFSKHGEIQDVLMKDDFAFVEFENYKSAQSALKELNGYAIGNTRIVVEEARPKDDDLDTANLLMHPRLYVGKLTENVKKQDLINTFSNYGEINDIIMKDDFAFLEFTNVQAATKALLDMNGAKFLGSKIVVEEAKPRDGEIIPRKTGGFKHGQPFASRYNVGDRERVGMASKRLPSRRRRSPYRSISRSRSAEKENGRFAF